MKNNVNIEETCILLHKFTSKENSTMESSSKIDTNLENINANYTDTFLYFKKEFIQTVNLNRIGNTIW